MSDRLELVAAEAGDEDGGAELSGELDGKLIVVDV